MSNPSGTSSSTQGKGTEAHKRFGKYSLVERIAVGGMAEIWRAKTYGAAGFEKELAIKRILQQFSVDEDFVRMFIDEARLAAKLQHANVIQIYDFDSVEVAEGVLNYYIAMEWLEGKDVRHLLKEGSKRKQPIPYADCVYIAIETLKGLHYAHTRVDHGIPLNIVHRDVSPHNILVSYSGDVKISDFGIAKAAARASATSNGMVKGKLAYMSPEQITGQPLDRRTDVFSMGIVLYEMLTRTRLFVGDSEIEVINKVRDGLVPPPRSRNPEIPEDVEAVLLKMLARKADDRYGTAAEAAKALSSTSLYAPSEALALGEYVANLFPPAAEASPQGVNESGARDHAAQSAQSSPLQQLPVAEKPAMANLSKTPPSEDNGAPTMMMEGPPPEVLAVQAAARAAAEAAAAPVAKATPTPARVATPVAPTPAAIPIAEQKTGILDGNSPEMQSAMAEIAAARAASRAPTPAPAAVPITEQKTAILEGSSAEVQNLLAQVAAAKAAVKAPPAAAPAIAEQKTAMLDGNNAELRGVMAQVAAARGGAPPAASLAPPPSAGPAPAGGAMRTMALDMSATAAASASAAAMRPAQQLAPVIATSAKPPSRAPRLLAGLALMLASCFATVLVLGAVHSAEAVKARAKEEAKPPPPPPPKVTGRIKLQTLPGNASVTLDGKPHPHFTPTIIEGPVGETVHVVVSLSGYKPSQQDVLFAGSEQTLTLPLDKSDGPPPVAAEAHGDKREKDAQGSAAPAEKEDRHHHHHGSPAAAGTPAASPAPAAAVAATSGARGTISIFVKPSASVTIDGKAFGKTPLPDVELTVGKHTVELVSDELGKKEKVTVKIKAGDNPELRRSWSN